ncbi:MAG: hypothetical protein Q7S92_05355 [Candidatus Diapherotrites archaeon]|nr:hypothetical protein [Candidatus Diapherotrites archaeon]
MKFSLKDILIVVLGIFLVYVLFARNSLNNLGRVFDRLTTSTGSGSEFLILIVLGLALLWYFLGNKKSGAKASASHASSHADAHAPAHGNAHNAHH